MSFPVASRWRYDHEWNPSYRCIQAGTLVKYLKFGAYKTMYTEVIHILLFMARQSKWRPCHAHTIHPKQKISITFHVTDLKSSLKCDICQILVISCCQDGALWVWLNISMWMGSGWDSYTTHKVSCTLDNVQSSYKHFVFLGESLKMAVLPHPHHDSNPKDFNNFWSKMGQEYTQRFQWESEFINVHNV